MSSGEEYLDNLLKSLTEGTGSVNAGPLSTTPDFAEADPSDSLQKMPASENVASEEMDSVMNMDDIEAMFASMGVETDDEELLSDEATSTDNLMTDEFPLDEGMLTEEMPMDELSLDEGMLTEEMPMDELSLDEGMLTEEMPMDELSLDEGILTEEMPMDELSLYEGMLTEEMPMDELSLDEGMLTEEMPMDELSLDEGMLTEEMPMDEQPLDEGMLSEETLMDGLSFDDGLLSDEDSASDDLNLDELGLGDLGLDELGSEEADTADTDMMIQEESDNESESGDGFALEEPGEDDSDLSALLASMGGDEALSEINDLLEKSDQGVAVDDDMLALLGDTPEGEEGEGSFDFFADEGSETEEGVAENIREITSEEQAEKGNPKTKQQKRKEEKERKKREKAAKKSNASQSAGAEDVDTLGGDSEIIGNGENKKKGFFAKFIDLLLEEDDGEGTDGDGEAGDVGLVIGNLTDENKELLDELSAEDKKNAKKKGKKEKKDKKDKKDKKKAEAAAEDGEEGGEDEAAEKPKKPKKVKKSKKEKKVEEEPSVPEKKLSKKKVTSVFLFCATIAACIVVVTMLLPQQMEKQEARIAFDNNQYAQVYELLYGKELNEEDEVLLHKSSLVLQMQRKLDSYDNYVKMDMPMEALNALIEGVDRYRTLREDAEMYNVGGEIASIYGQILARLSDNYGLSESDAMDIISSGDDVSYSQRLQSIIFGVIYDEGEETQPMEKQDVLPEEEEIIDRLQGTETE